MTTLPTFVSRKNCRTAGVALSSLKSSLTVDARGCFHSHAFPTLLYSSLIWASQVMHLMKRWCRNCISPLLHHQHLSDRIVFVTSARYGPITA